MAVLDSACIRMWSGHKSFLRMEMGTPFGLSISLFHTRRLTFLGCYDYESERNIRNSTVDHLFVVNSFKGWHCSSPGEHHERKCPTDASKLTSSGPCERRGHPKLDRSTSFSEKLTKHILGRSQSGAFLFGSLVFQHHDDQAHPPSSCLHLRGIFSLDHDPTAQRGPPRTLHTVPPSIATEANGDQSPHECPRSHRKCFGTARHLRNAGRHIGGRGAAESAAATEEVEN